MLIRDRLGIQVDLAQPSGSFRPALRSYVIRVHGAHEGRIDRNGRPMEKIVSASAENPFAGWSVDNRKGSIRPGNHLSSYCAGCIHNDSSEFDRCCEGALSTLRRRITENKASIHITR